MTKLEPILISAPPSKSLSHRALICAALAHGESRLSGLLESQDIARTMACLRRLGADMEQQGEQVLVRGIRPGAGNPLISLDVGESGTTCRLMLGVVAAIPGEYRFYGQGRMHDRPVADLTDALLQQGMRIDFEEKPGYPPLRMVSPGLAGGEVSLNLEHSSQYLSGLLLAAPLAAGRTIIRLTGKSVASWPYVALTVDAMAACGVPVTVERTCATGWESCTLSEAATLPPVEVRFLIDPAPYQAHDMQVEGDWSNASYFLAAGAVGTCPVRLTGLNRHTTQGDRFMLDILERMGARVEWAGDANTGNGVTRDCVTRDSVTVFPSALRGAHLDMSACPDIVPTVAVLAAFATGETVISGAAHLQVKECDRIQGPVTELTKAGVRIEARRDGMVIHGSGLAPRTVNLCCYGDHRMAMSLSLLELGGLTVRLDAPDCVAKSFPGFWAAWEKIRQGNGLTSVGLKSGGDHGA